MVNLITPGYVYRVDRFNPKIVISGWRDVHHFTSYCSATGMNHNMAFVFQTDYDKKFGGTNDGKHPHTTNDQRFCFSKWYRGLIYKYDSDGQFVEEMMMEKFFLGGGKNYSIGRFVLAQGSQIPRELRNRGIMVMVPQLGFFWDFEKLDEIDTIIIDDTVRDEIGEDAYEQLRSGELIVESPYKLKRAYGANRKREAPSADQPQVFNRSGNRRGLYAKKVRVP